jgi:hypothetical protein
MKHFAPPFRYLSKLSYDPASPENARFVFSGFPSALKFQHLPSKQQRTAIEGLKTTEEEL